MPPTPTMTNDTGSAVTGSSRLILTQFGVLVQQGHVVVVFRPDGDAVARAEDEPPAGLGAGHGPPDVRPDVFGRPAEEVLDGDPAPERDPVAVVPLQAADVHAGRRLDGLVGVEADLDEEIQQQVDVAAAVLEDLLAVPVLDVPGPLLVGLEEEVPEHGRPDERPGLVAV